MIKQEITIRCTDGLHIRPCEMIVVFLNNIESSVKIIKENTEINAKSVISLLSLCIKKNDKLTLIIDGKNENEDLKKIISFLKDKRYIIIERI